MSRWRTSGGRPTCPRRRSWLRRPTRPPIPGGIWTTTGELPFAGHPTIGSAHAWLEAGECPGAATWWWWGAAPGSSTYDAHRGSGRRPPCANPARWRGPACPHVHALGVTDPAVEDMAWIDNGPGWVGVDLGSADAVVGVARRRRLHRPQGHCPRWLGRESAEGSVPTSRCVRSTPTAGSSGRTRSRGAPTPAGPVTLIGAGALPSSYTSRQGSVTGREGGSGSRPWPTRCGSRATRSPGSSARSTSDAAARVPAPTSGRNCPEGLPATTPTPSQLTMCGP